MIRIAIVENIAERKQTPSAQKGVINYCVQPQKTQADERTVFVSGVNCVPELAEDSFLATQRLYGHRSGSVRFYHYVQSFHPNENVTPELAHRIALELASFFGNREVLVATHLDSDHLHSHFVIDSYDLSTGKKLHMNKFTLADLRRQSDSLCQKYGLSVLPEYDPKEKSANLRPGEYRAAMKGESWKFLLMNVISETMNTSGSREEFIRGMKRRGYGMTWTDERKYITFTCPSGMKCRDIRLHDNRFLKGVLEYEFKLRQQILLQFRSGNTDAEEHGELYEADRNAVSSSALRDPRGAAGTGAQDSDGRDELSAGALQTDFLSSDERGTQEPRDRDSGYRGNLYGADGESADRGERENGLGNEDADRTGWEESREIYLRSILSPEPDERGNADNCRVSERPYRENSDRHGGLGSYAFGLGMRGLAEVSRIIDNDTEDPEERRKRIEAETNGENLGAAVGLIIGGVMAMREAEEDANKETEEEESDLYSGPKLGM